jgi:hypothetical protein
MPVKRKIRKTIVRMALLNMNWMLIPEPSCPKVVWSTERGKGVTSVF